jgi:tetratricopeptide (TPR) repeat protein
MLSDPLEALQHCHDRLRHADFDRQLYDYVLAFDGEWNQLSDNGRWLQGRAVAAEVYDYFGDYPRARASLDPATPGILDAIDPLRDRVDALHKRRIWVTIGVAHARYRAEDYSTASLYLNQCLERLNRADPEATQFFGTRARLSYSLGQISRQQQQYDEALKHFADVCHFAAERLRQKTPFLELVGPPQAGLPQLSDPQGLQLERERLLASWTIGKSLAFGVGWIHYTTGNLRGASVVLNSGYSLLRCTGDWIHRAYAQLLLSATERARGGDKSRVDRATRRVQESEEGLSQHPAFRSRAGYERAISLLHSSDAKGALEVIRRIRRDLAVPTPSESQATARRVSKATRWTCNLLVLEARAQRQLGQYQEALTAAGTAISTAGNSGHVTSQIEGLIARAEVLIEKEQKGSLRSQREAAERASKDLQHALRLLEANPNPKMEAACWLHLSRAHRLAGAIEDARKAFGVWAHEYASRVEHRFLRELAQVIQRDIGMPDRFIVSSASDNLNAAQYADGLQAFLIRAAAERSKNAEQQAKLLGISERTLRDWVARLGDRYDLGKRLGR